jgi:hypothetical protein
MKIAVLLGAIKLVVPGGSPTPGTAWTTQFTRLWLKNTWYPPFPTGSLTDPVAVSGTTSAQKTL